MQNFLQPGRVVDALPPYDVLSGQGFLTGSRFQVATSDRTLASGLSVPAYTEGIFSLAKTSAQAWADGDPVAWDDTNKRCDSDLTKGPLVGTAYGAAANPSSAGFVKLNESSVKRVSNVKAGTPAPTSISTAGAGTLSAAQLMTGVIVRDTNGASRTDTLDTAAAIVAAVPGAKVGDMLECYIINGADAAEVLTIAAGTGGGFDANQTASSRDIIQNTSKLLHIRLTNVTPSSEAYVAYL